ncbi:hypothetical protein ACVWZW_005302 [Bradyrhizobium sp. F1.13.4]
MLSAFSGSLMCSPLVDDAELLQQLREIDAAGRVVDDDAHRTFGGVGAEINHRTLEALVAHYRHGDQQLAVQVARRTGQRGAGLAGAFACPLACGSHR